MPNTGGFSLSSIPHPRAPLSRFLLSLRPFFNCFRVTFVTCGKVDFIAFHFVDEDYIWLLAAYRLPELPGHFLVARENRESQVIKLSMAAFTKVTLAVRLSTIHTLTDNVITFAAGTTYTIWPAEFANIFVALGVIEEVIELHGEAVLHQSPCCS